jgi:Xaa-Pro aminopeptidase
MFDLVAIQSALKEFQLDGWLLCDFRQSNVLARRVLDVGSERVTSRRFFYCIPTHGKPRKLVHRIESGVLDHLPGDKTVYLSWRELEAGISRLLAGLEKIAMEYSPRNANPYVSRVDAGTVELVDGLGVAVESSGDLVQLFEATWDDAAWQSHLESARHTCAAFDRAWQLIARRTRDAAPLVESDVQREIMSHFRENGLFTDHPPVVAVGPHSNDPHYSPTPQSDAPIRAGDFVLIDLWAKMDRPGSVYSDYTRVGFAGDAVPEKYENIFAIVARARDAAIDRVRTAMATGERLCGYQVDDAARQVIDGSGYGPYFVHRTGHSIGQETHGNGANMDNLETHDERRVLRRTCFSIEPGIYLDEFGVRSEVNVYVDAAGAVHVTGEPQQAVLAVLA